MYDIYSIIQRMIIIRGVCYRRTDRRPSPALIRAVENFVACMLRYLGAMHLGEKSSKLVSSTQVGIQKESLGEKLINIE